MNTKITNLPGIPVLPSVLRWPLIQAEPLLLLLSLLLLWFLVPGWLHKLDQTTGNIDQSIWLLILLSLISFMLIAILCWWLLQRFWQAMGLPAFKKMVSQFNQLSIWQQLNFYWASFALLLLLALGCLSAIC